MKTIMIAEDSGIIRAMVKSSLIDPYQVLEAEDGKQGLEVAQKSAVDLFLLDLNMPVRDGFGLLEDLRKLPQFSKTPIIMLTTEARDDFKERGKAFGATGWVVKPVEPDRLRGLVDKILK